MFVQSYDHECDEDDGEDAQEGESQGLHFRLLLGAFGFGVVFVFVFLVIVKIHFLYSGTTIERHWMREVAARCFLVCSEVS